VHAIANISRYNYEIARHGSWHLQINELINKIVNKLTINKIKIWYESIAIVVISSNNCEAI